jgi:hypothetical protein
MLGRPVSVIELAGYRRRADELLTADEISVDSYPSP